jgi:recombination protein RecR
MALIPELIDALKRLPGVGAKTAQRMAFHLLEHDRPAALALAQALTRAVEGIQRCQLCRNLTELEICSLCSHPQRDPTLLCIVESPADLHALDVATGYRGRYFVLHGRLSPIDGLGPSELGFELLTQRLGEGTIQEVIVATNPTVEGEATAHFIRELCEAGNVSCTRIAHGVPMGGELEYIDRSTLAHAFNART